MRGRSERPRRPARPAPPRKKRPARPAQAKPSTWYLLVGLVGVLVVIGLVMVLSASSVLSQRESGSTWSYFLRQSIWAGISLGVLYVVSRIDYRFWRRVIPLLLVGAFGLLLVVLVPGFGIRVNGARSWLGVGPLRLQPAEVVKLALLLFCADLLARRHTLMDDWRLTLAPVLTVVGAAAVLMMLQPDLGSTIVMGAIVIAVLFVAGVPLGWLTLVTTVGSSGALVLALGKAYRRNRLLAFLHPSKDPTNTGYQINQSLMGVASGRWFGVGLGESRAKWGFLPNAHTDFIFAIIAEELGLVGALLVVGLFLAFAVLGIRAALHAPDRFGTLVAAGVTAWILTQAFVNIGGVVGILPITGLTLPFISFGGTSLVVTMAATGLLLNVAGHGGDAARRPTTRQSDAHPSRRPALSSR
ncbi:MAG: cell division protein FtsW [Actinomycetota bacterium]|nr:cell division protein FtsW [Actinomycetota bacterium]